MVHDKRDKEMVSDVVYKILTGRYKDAMDTIKMYGVRDVDSMIMSVASKLGSNELFEFLLNNGFDPSKTANGTNSILMNLFTRDGIDKIEIIVNYMDYDIDNALRDWVNEIHGIKIETASELLNFLKLQKVHGA